MRYAIIEAIPCLVEYRYIVEATSEQEALTIHARAEDAPVDHVVGEILDFVDCPPITITQE